MPQESTHAHHWSYSTVDEWCNQFPVGQRQSPIDIIIDERELESRRAGCCSDPRSHHAHGHHAKPTATRLRPQLLQPAARREHLNSTGDETATPPGSVSPSDSPVPEALLATHVTAAGLQRTRYCTTNRKLFVGYPRYLGPTKIRNTGHSWQIDLEEPLAAHTLVCGPPFGEREYRLAQLHCHWGSDEHSGSEHLINGRAYAAEIHFVHWNCTEFSSLAEASRSRHGLAVLAVMVEAAGQRSQQKQDNQNKDDDDHNEHHNRHLDKILGALDSIETPGSSMGFTARLDLKKLLPVNRWLYATYEGSLTTPPLSEVVDWLVFLDPIRCSAKQIERFRRLRCPSLKGDAEMEELRHNCRPVQPLNDRLVSIWSHH